LNWTTLLALSNIIKGFRQPVYYTFRYALIVLKHLPHENHIDGDRNQAEQGRQGTAQADHDYDKVFRPARAILFFSI
jgi:hypothetical protein